MVEKKVLSILLIVIMLIAIFNPVIVNAESSVPEGAITFQDEGLFYALKRGATDANKDGYITIEEMENITSLYINGENYIPIKSLEELKYAKNLTKLTIYALNSDISEYNLESLTNLKYFSIQKSLDETDENYKMDKENIKVADNVFVYDELKEVGTEKSYYVYGIAINEKEISVEKYDVCALDVQDTAIFRYAKIEDENIAKVASMVMVEGINVGNTKITFSNEFTTIEIPIIVTEAEVEINANQELENSNVTGKLVNDRVLMSNGDLWKINSKDEAVKEDTNVSDYVYLYYRDNGRKTMYIKLKNDGTLSVSGYLEDSNQEITKEISNVKKLLVNKGYKTAYLDNNNDVYLLSINSDTKQIDTRLIETDVEKVQGAFYVKNGNTYYLNGQLIVEDVMDVAENHAFAIKNNLYQIKEPYNGNGEISSTLIAADFDSFLDEQYWEDYDVLYKSTNGDTKTVSGDIRDDYKYYSTSLFGIFIDNNNILCRHNLQYLSDVTDFIAIKENENDYQPSYVIALRKDGTVWTKKYDEITNFEKIISQTKDDVDLGNIDGDEEVTIKDVRLALQCSLSKTELSEVQIKAADVNKDGEVNIKDVRLILQYSLNKISEF